jgi:hypothetical protein
MEIVALIGFIFLIVFIALVSIEPIKAKQNRENNALFVSNKARATGLMADRMVEHKEFVLLIDNTQKKWLIKNGNYESRVFNYNDLNNYEIYEDGETIMRGHTQGRAGSVLVGGALLGPVGAIAGASRKKKNTTKSVSTCKTLQLRIQVNDVSKPEIVIDFIKPNWGIEKNTTAYKGALESAKSAAASLSFMQNDIENTVLPLNPSANESIEERLKYLTNLYEKGLLTEQEYSDKRKELIGQL